MDQGSSSQWPERPPALDPRGEGTVAGHLLRERQRRELRRERDALLLDLARDRDLNGLAEQLGLSPDVAGKLLDGARERLDPGVRSLGGPEPRTRSRDLDRERWAEIDAHYEALGSGPALIDRRWTSRRPR